MKITTTTYLPSATTYKVARPQKDN